MYFKLNYIHSFRNLKALSERELYETFDENERTLAEILHEYINVQDHTITSSDYLTILYNLVTSEQQKIMYKKIHERFFGGILMATDVSNKNRPFEYKTIPNIFLILFFSMKI